MSYKFYAGIGSRQTPSAILARMVQIATWLEEDGYTLRSGGARGADQAFAAGVSGRASIYVPWPGFEGSNSQLYLGNPPLTGELLKQANTIAMQNHPRWSVLRDPIKRLMVRTVFQIIGTGGPAYYSKFVICWTPLGKDDGGTGQAVRIAQGLGIPVINLAHFADDAFDTKEKLLAFINSGSINDIRGFYGKYSFLSNMHHVLMGTIIYDGTPFSSVEHAYQYAKKDYFSDTSYCKMYADHIYSATDAYEAKRWAKDYSGLLLKEWFTARIDIMRGLCIQKFNDADMRKLIISTGSVMLIESNVWHDTFWGMYRGVGENMLGNILMNIRAELQ